MLTMRDSQTETDWRGRPLLEAQCHLCHDWARLDAMRTMRVPGFKQHRDGSVHRADGDQRIAHDTRPYAATGSVRHSAIRGGYAKAGRQTYHGRIGAQPTMRESRIVPTAPMMLCPDCQTVVEAYHQAVRE